MVHDSDVDTEAKFTELRNIDNILRTWENKIRTYQRCIRALDMTKKSSNTGEITYSLPNSIAGSEIDSDYRLAQKEELIKNIDNLIKDIDMNTSAIK